MKNKKTKTIQKKKSHILFLLGLLAILVYGILTVFDVYSRENALQIFIPQTQQNIIKGDKVILNFSSPVNGKFNLNNISIQPNLQFQTKFLNNKQIELEIVGKPTPDKKYNIYISNIPTFWLSLRKNLQISLSAVTTPQSIIIKPQNKTTEVTYNTPIEITLPKKLDRHIYLSADINPDMEMETIINDAKNNITLKPRKEWNKAQKYDITITAHYHDDKNYNKKIYYGTFTTKIPPRVIYNFPKEGQPQKTEDITWNIPAKISDGKYIDIDLTHQVMSIFENGLRKSSYKVSSGKRGMNTPTGTFHILSKGRRPWSAHYGLYMPWYMGFTSKGHGIHELPEWPSGYKEGANHLGIPVSHGCVRLGIGPAKVVYDFASKGTPVVVHY